MTAWKKAHFANPEEVGAALRGVEWGTVTVSGHVTYIICPMCASVVPAHNHGNDELNPKEMHTDYHVSIADELRRAGRASSMLGPF